MKKCPFCGEEIQDSAKKCRFCGEWLEFKECPVCGESIPAKTTVCSYCNEKQEGGDLGNDIIPKVPVLTLKDKLINIIKNYGILLLILFGIIFWAFYGGNGNDVVDQDDSGTTQSIIQPNDYVYNIHKDAYYCEDCVNTGFEQLSFQGITGGYLLFNDYYSCMVKGENIDKFVKSIKKGVFNYCNPVNLDNLDNLDDEDKLAIVVDNSYSENTGDLGIGDLYNRIKSIGRILNSKSGKNIKLSLQFIYSTRATPDEPEMPNCDSIYFEIDESAFPINVAVYTGKGSDFIYRENYRSLEFQNLSLATSRGTGILCDESEKNKYICYDLDSIYNQIQKLWSENYNKSGMHEGNPLFECLNNTRLYDNDEIYVITDGQFELTDNQAKLKNYTKKEQFSNDYPLSNFHDYVYRQASDKFEKFWSEKLFDLWTGVDCKGKNVYFVGLRDDDPLFYDYMVEFYKEKFFINCDVSEK